MQNNNRKKIIFLDGNYSEGGNDGLDGGVVTNATPPAGQSVGVGQSGVVNCKRVPTSENQESNANIVGKGEQESDQRKRIPTEGEDILRTELREGYIREGESDDEGSQEGSQGQEGSEEDDDDEGSKTVPQEGKGVVQEGGDYDYDLLSEGGRSSIDSASVVSSVATNELLSVDPLYIRLTKFLETSNKMEGGSTANIADLLYDVSSSLKSIKESFQGINSTLQKLAVTKASQ